MMDQVRAVFFLVIFFSAFFTPRSYSQEDLLFGINFQQNPSKVVWKYIETEHFRVIFPQEIEFKAQRVAHLLEGAYPFVSRSLEVRPPLIPVVLHPKTLVSNGFVALAPRRSEWFLTPPYDPEISNTDWMKTLAIHEFRHVVQFEKTKSGFNEVLRLFLGEIGEALGVALTVPPWFLEGDAVGIETALTQGGRGRLPLFERDLRTLILSKKKFSYDKAHLGSYEDYVPNHYVYGYFYTSWLRNEYGDLFLSRLVDRSAHSSWNPLSFYHSVEDLTDTRFEKFYQNVMRDLLGEWKKRLDKIPLTSFRVLSLDQLSQQRLGWTNYLFPQKTPEGKILALKNGLSFIDQFVLLDPKQKGKEERLFYPGKLQGHYPFKLRGGKLSFFEQQVDPRWGMRDFSRLKVYDLSKKTFVLDKPQLKGRLAVGDHAGKRIAFVEWSELGKQKIIVLNERGEEIFGIPYPLKENKEEEVITGMDWFSDEEVVVVTKDQNDFKSIQKIHLSTLKETTLLSKRMTNLGFISSEGGVILVEAPDSGVDNIYELKGEELIQLTSSSFGAYAPTLSNQTLIYNDYSVEGMRIVEKDLPWSLEQKSQDSFYPIYEKFSQSEGLKDFEKELSKNKPLSSNPYSGTEHAVNLHSWIFLAPPLSPSVTLLGLSRDILNKLTLFAGGEYNLNERAMKGVSGVVWSHFYPVFDLQLSYGGRRQAVELADKKIQDHWEEGIVETGVSLPWKFIQERFRHSFTLRAFSRLLKVTGKISEDLSEISDGALHSPGGEFNYSLLQRLSFRDMNPPLGLTLRGRWEEGRDITGDNERGALQSYEGRIYLPGLSSHHSFYHQVSFEKQRDRFYQYPSLVFYPRGTPSVFLREFRKYSGNYLLPLFYPDKSFSRYLYLKRLSLNLFYDELNGQYISSYRSASTGWETLFELHALRLFFPITLGVRGSYVLSGMEKKQNYEIFLSTIGGSFNFL